MMTGKLLFPHDFQYRLDSYCSLLEAIPEIAIAFLSNIVLNQRTKMRY